MRSCDSAYDRATAEWRANDPGPGVYALIVERNGPLSRVDYFGSLDEAVASARAMDATDDWQTDLEIELDYDAARDRDSSGLVDVALRSGWWIVATAPAGEHWIVLYEPDLETSL